MAVVAAERAPMFAVALFAGEAAIVPPVAELATAGSKPAVGLLVQHQERGFSNGACCGGVSLLPTNDAKGGRAVAPKGMRARFKRPGAR